MGARPAQWLLTWFLILIPQRELKEFLVKWFSSLTVGGKHLERESINELMWQQPLFPKNIIIKNKDTNICKI